MLSCIEQAASTLQPATQRSDAAADDERQSREQYSGSSNAANHSNKNQQMLDGRSAAATGTLSSLGGVQISRAM